MPEAASNPEPHERGWLCTNAKTDHLPHNCRYLGTILHWTFWSCTTCSLRAAVHAVLLLLLILVTISLLKLLHSFPTWPGPEDPTCSRLCEPAGWPEVSPSQLGVAMQHQLQGCFVPCHHRMPCAVPGGTHTLHVNMCFRRSRRPELAFGVHPKYFTQKSEAERALRAGWRRSSSTSSFQKVSHRESRLSLGESSCVVPRHHAVVRCRKS